MELADSFASFAYQGMRHPPRLTSRERLPFPLENDPRCRGKEPQNPLGALSKAQRDPVWRGLTARRDLTKI